MPIQANVNQPLIDRTKHFFTNDQKTYRSDYEHFLNMEQVWSERRTLSIVENMIRSYNGFYDRDHHPVYESQEEAKKDILTFIKPSKQELWKNSVKNCSEKEINSYEGCRKIVEDLMAKKAFTSTAIDQLKAAYKKDLQENYESELKNGYKIINGAFKPDSNLFTFPEVKLFEFCRSSIQGTRQQCADALDIAEKGHKEMSQQNKLIEMPKALPEKFAFLGMK